MGKISYFNYDLGKLIQCFDKRMRKVQDDMLSKYQLTHFHAWYLANLHRYGEMNMTDLTNKIGVDKANTTRAVKDLMSKGYIEKVGNSERKYNIKLTDKGSIIAQTFKDHIDKKMKNSFKYFTEEEKKIFFKLLNKLFMGVNDVGNF